MLKIVEELRDFSGIEALKRPARPGETTRVVMADGIWRTSSG